MSEPPEFQLIETLRWTPSTSLRFRFLKQHLTRLQHSAAALGFQYPSAAIKQSFHQLQQSHTAQTDQRMRILLFQKGSFQIEISPLESKPTQAVVAISTHRTKASCPFLSHKTTRRTLYDTEWKRFHTQGCWEVLFFNTRHELTEGSRTNIFLKQNGYWVTPALQCGLLNGIYRKKLLSRSLSLSSQLSSQSPRIKVREKILTMTDLQTAQQIYISNSVQGLIRVQLHENFAHR